jgi:hypothetical protein
MPLKAQITVNGEKSIRAAGVAVACGEGYGHCVYHILVSVLGKLFKRVVCRRQLPQSVSGVGSCIM